MARTVVRSSRVQAPLEAVWEHASSMDGVNRELAPWVRMSVPGGAKRRSLEHAPLGRVAFRSVLLAGSALPFDVHALRLVEVEPPRRFLERSTSWLQRSWEHERTLSPEGPGATRVTNRVRFEPRVPGAGPLAARLVAALFTHRHARLRARFGSS